MRADSEIKKVFHTHFHTAIDQALLRLDPKIDGDLAGIHFAGGDVRPALEELVESCFNAFKTYQADKANA